MHVGPYTYNGGLCVLATAELLAAHLCGVLSLAHTDGYKVVTGNKDRNFYQFAVVCGLLRLALRSRDSELLVQGFQKAVRNFVHQLRHTSPFYKVAFLAQDPSRKQARDTFAKLIWAHKAVTEIYDYDYHEFRLWAARHDENRDDIYHIEDNMGNKWLVDSNELIQWTPRTWPYTSSTVTQDRTRQTQFVTVSKWDVGTTDSTPMHTIINEAIEFVASFDDDLLQGGVGGGGSQSLHSLFTSTLRF